MDDPLDIKRHIRCVDDFPIPGVKFRDITSLVETPIALKKTCNQITKISRKFEPNLLVGIESRGFIFSSPVALDLSIPFVLARKPGKLPHESYSRHFDLEYGSTSIELQKNTQISRHDKILIVDDLVATGGTAIACCDLLTKHFDIERSNILFVAVIDLPHLGGSQRILEAGYGLEILVSYK